MGGWLKDAKGITHPVESYSIVGLDWGLGELGREIIKEYKGLGRKMPRSLHCRGKNGIG